jgi:hypothetical protein
LPCSEEELKNFHKAAKFSALEEFKKTAIGDIKDDYRVEIVKKMKAKMGQLQFENEK